MDNRIRTYRPMYKKGRKYGNRKVQIDGYTFDSAHEGNRYIELKYRMLAGEIKDLELQKQYELQPAFRNAKTGKLERPVYYRSDFTYFDIERGETVIEDAKSVATRKDKVYQLKRKLMAYKGMYIEEV